VPDVQDLNGSGVLKRTYDLGNVIRSKDNLKRACYMIGLIIDNMAMNTRSTKMNERNLQEEEEDYEYERPLREDHEKNRLSMSRHSQHDLEPIDERDVMDRMDRMENEVSKVVDNLRDLSTTVREDIRSRQNPNTGFSPPGMSTPHISSMSSGLQPRQISRPNDKIEDRAFNWRETFGNDSDASVHDYIRRFEMYAATKNWTDLAKATSFMSTLEGHARFITREVTARYSWRDIRQLLESEWEPANQTEILREKLSRRNRTTKEAPEQYLRVLQDLAARAYGDYPAEMVKDIVFRQFKQGQPDYISDAIYMVEFRDVGHALNYVQKLEARPVRRRVHTAAARVDIPELYDEGHDKTLLSPKSEGVPAKIEEEATLWVRRAFAYIETDEGGYYDEEELYGLLRTTAATVDNLTPQNICFFCRKPGHRWMKCFRLREQLVRNGMKDNRDTSANTGRPNYEGRKPYTPRTNDDRDDKRNFPIPIKPSEN